MAKRQSGQRSSKKLKLIFTVGERNFLIDSLLHPIARIDPMFVIVDEIVACRKRTESN
jgi:hypothetical protein